MMRGQPKNLNNPSPASAADTKVSAANKIASACNGHDGRKNKASMYFPIYDFQPKKARKFCAVGRADKMGTHSVFPLIAASAGGNCL